MTYPPQPGGYGQPDPYQQQPGGYPQQPGGQPQQPGGYPQQPGGYPQQPGGYSQDPVTGVPMSPGGGPAGGYAQPAYGGQPGYGAPVQAPGPRPSKVTIAAFASIGAAAMLFLNALIGIIVSNIALTNLREAGYNVSSVSDNTASYVLSFIIAAVLILTGIFLLRGMEWARIVGFIGHGLMVLCAGVGIFGVLAASALIDQLRGFDGVFPGWYIPVSVIVLVISLALSITAIIVLASRETGDWLRAHTTARAAGIIR